MKAGDKKNSNSDTSRKNSSNNKNNTNTNNNNKTVKNSRFTFAKEELKILKDEAKAVKEEAKIVKEEVKPKVEKQKEKQKQNISNRFDMLRLMEEPVKNEIKNEIKHEIKQNIKNEVPIKVSVVNVSEPILQHVVKQTIDIVNDFPDFKSSLSSKSDTKNINTSQNSYSKAIKHENIITDDNKKRIVQSGWVSIVKNTSGRSEIIYGPKTEYEKNKEYLRTNLNHQMGLAISKMEENWNRYEQLYNSFHGENAYKERYGYVPTFEDDEYDEYDEDDDASFDSLSDDYESE
jgi:hypothetical protein